jgi:hypothetical protein
MSFDTAKIEVLGNFIIHDLGLKFKTIKNLKPSFRKLCFNPDLDFFNKFGYHPKLTAHEYLVGAPGKWIVRKFEIEGSLPKIKNGTSYFNINQSDYEAIIEAIPKKLANFGLMCEPTDIERGNLQIIAYCYNFFLTPQLANPKDYILPMVFLDMGKRTGNIIEKLWMQIEEGYGIKFFNRLRGIGFYDKVAEIENNKFQTKEDREIVKLVKAGKLPHCFKIENTLQNRTAVKKGLAHFYDKNEKKERTLREAMQDRISLAFTKNTFYRLADPCNVKALEQMIYSLSSYYETMKKQKLSFIDAQLFLAHCIATQQFGSLELKNIADGFSKYGRQYRQYYYDRLAKIVPKIKGQKLSGFFDYCKKQIDNPVNPQTFFEDKNRADEKQATQLSML